MLHNHFPSGEHRRLSWREPQISSLLSGFKIAYNGPVEHLPLSSQASSFRCLGHYLFIYLFIYLLRCALSCAVYCNRPCLCVCVCVCVCVCLFVGPPYYSQRAVFASPLSAFSFIYLFVCLFVCLFVRSFIHSFIHSFTRSTHARTHPSIHLLIITIIM